MITATPYIRVSSKGQVEGDGFDRQLEKITLFCAQHGLTLGVVHNEAVSGTVDAMERPVFSQLMQEMEGGVIIVERMDRLARDLMVQEFLLRECRNRGIQVFAADQTSPIDMASNAGDPTRVLIRQILGALAQWEKAMLVAKLAAARNRIKATGTQCEGNKPYGALPGEATIIKLVVDLHQGDVSLQGIADMLNQNGFKNRRGDAWRKRQIYDLVKKFNRPARESESENV